MMGANQSTPTPMSSTIATVHIINRKTKNKQKLTLPVQHFFIIEYTLDKVDGDKVWLLAVITGGNTRELKERVFDLKRDSDVRVYMTNRENNLSLDVLISKEEAK